MQTQPYLSVVICTYNRADQLSRALDSILRARPPGAVPYELLVVDNNSNDHTRALIERYQARHPGVFRYVFERRQGLSCARNRGIDSARGDWIVFTDDDVTVRGDWLATIAARIQADAALRAYGGRIVPEWNCRPPSWFASSGRYAMSGGHIVRLDLGADTSSFSPGGKSPIGANMGFHRSVFDAVGFFREDLGKKGHRQTMGDDSEFCRRLQQNGIQIAYMHEAVVYHGIDKDRLTVGNLFNGYYHVGLSIGLQKRFPQNARIIAGIPVFLFGTIGSHILQGLRALLRRNRQAALYHAFEITYAAGKICGTQRKKPIAK
jgi:glycosyltransferase involved in cell wall biosynthesis